MAHYRQDTAPSGGYQEIKWSRAYIPKKFYGAWIVAGFVASKVAFLTYYMNTSHVESKRIIAQENDARIALQPLIYAEADRKKLRELRACRDEEAYLMRDNEKWQVGMLDGEQLYSNSVVRFQSSGENDTDAFREPLRLDDVRSMRNAVTSLFSFGSAEDE